MKRSDFKKRLDVGRSVEDAACLAEEAGATWDPEEEEAPVLRPCPACGADAKKEDLFGDDYVHCSDEDCELCGPSGDPDGAKWNALPRREANPEAPELPKRISADSLYAAGDPPISRVLRAEASRRYNAVGRILEHACFRNDTALVWLRKLIDEEGVTR